MGYDSKGILVFNLKYEHAISFIDLVKFIIKCHGQYHRNCSVRLTCTDHRIIEILGLRPSNRLPVSYYHIGHKTWTKYLN
jgi:hypothetical protein